MISLAPLATALALLAAPPLPPAASGRDVDAERASAALAALERDRGPRAVAALRTLDEVAGALPDRAHVIAGLAALAADPATDPEIRSLARWHQAAHEQARGNLHKAAALVGRLGFVTRWLVIGPFDDEGKRGLDTSYPPEQAINLGAGQVDLGAGQPGKAREVRWRPLPAEAVVDGSVVLGATLRPDTEVLAYALAVVDAPRATEARLWFGGSGRARVWVNGQVAVTDTADHPQRLDQHGAVVALRQGPNRILVKQSHGPGTWAFALRLADERGDGLGLVSREPAALLAGLPPLPPRGQPPRPVAGLVERLEAAAAVAGKVPGLPGSAARRAEAEARLTLAAALAVRQPADLPEHRPAREARRAAELAPGWVEARLLAADLEEERNRRLEHLRAAQAAAPDDPRVLRGLAQVAIALDRPQEAVRLLQRVVAVAPGWVAARLTLAVAREQAGQGMQATLERLALGERTPPTAPAAAAAASAARRLGRLDQAAGLSRTALALQVDDGATRASLANLLLARGDVAGSVALAEEALRLDPADLSTRLRLADLLAANGRGEEAEAAWAAALRICPEEADAWERRGRARLLAGRRAEALADLARALELRPQSPALKELVRSLEPAREKFEAPDLLDAAALARAPGGAAADDDTVTLGEVEVVRVHRSGLASRYSQRVVKVLTQRGADAARRQAVGYTPDRQEVKIERGRIFKADGSVVESWDESERSASEPWYRLYYDTRSKTLTFPSLAPGDVLEVAWRVDDTAAENLLSDYFGDLAFIEDGEPKRRWEYVLLMPQGRAIHANAPAGVTRADRDLPGGLTEHRWRAQDVPRIDAEPRMPGWAEVARFLHVSTYASWEEVNRFYWGLVQDQLKPTEELRATARKLAEDALKARGVDPAVLARGAGTLDQPSQLAIVAAVHAFVVTQTRYVGLEFGIHGYKPYRVDQILSRRFGDCKDKASLTHALLEAVGIDSRLVLLRMRRLGRIPEQPASLAVFNHAILHLPQFGLWLDGTAGYTGTREIPGEDRGATVLVVDPGGKPWFGRTPEARPEENVVDARFDVTLGADGAARVDGQSRITGTQAGSYRRSYQAENDRRATLEQAFNRVFPGLSVEQVSFGDLGRLEEDVTMRFRLRAPRYAEAGGGQLRFTPFGAGSTYTETWASLSSRKHDLVIGEPATSRYRYRVALPPGWSVRELPEPAAGDGPHAAFEVRYRQEPGAVVVEGFVTLKSPLVPPADYPAFRDTMLRIDAAFSRRVVAAPAVAVQEAR